MRKNGVIRELRAIRGGICAVEGFQTGVGKAGFRGENAPDLALILADKRCPTACVCLGENNLGATNTVTQKHLQNGYAQAILIHSGVVNAFLPNGEKLARETCSLVEKYYGVLREDVIVASVGEMRKSLPLESLEKGLQSVSRTIGREECFSDLAARVIASDGQSPCHFAYSFMIGDYFCKIGGVCAHTNEGTTLVILTTDTHISSEMLQKALTAETKETLDLLHIDGLRSPNDLVCIMANGKAGNSLIDRADSEYKKFCYSLRAALTSVCALLSAEGGKNQTVFCKVTGAKSKQTARALALSIVENEKIKNASGKICTENILYKIAEKCEGIDMQTVRASVAFGENETVLYEDGEKIPVSLDLTAFDEIGFCIDLSQGNYSATAYGRGRKK